MKNNQPQSKRGGKRPGAGRRKGSPNKVTADVKAAAQKYTTEALDTLAVIMRSGEAPEAARVAAANSLLDRGHGKSTAIIETTITERYVVRAPPKPKDALDWREQNAPAHGPH